LPFHPPPPPLICLLGEYALAETVGVPGQLVLVIIVLISDSVVLRREEDDVIASSWIIFKNLQVAQILIVRPTFEFL